MVKSGSQLKKIFSHIMRIENRDGEGECYQINSGIEAIYDDQKKELESLSINGKLVDDKKDYSICLQDYHASSCQDYLNISEKELRHSGKSKVISTSAQGVLEEYLENHQNITRKIEGRLVFNK